MRALGAWLALAYVYASAAGAAGAGGCIHADAGGEGHGHGVQAEVPAHSASDHHAAVPMPCASGEDQQQELAKSTSHHSSSDPCDCLGDCSIGTGMADLYAVRTPCAAGRTATDASLPSPDRIETCADQHRLPYPNAPPFL